MKKLLLVFFLLCLLMNVPLAQDLVFKNDLTKIAIGSCNRQDAPQLMWPHINSHNPDLWIWLGDNIYGDTDDMSVMKAKYDKQKSNPEYQKLVSNTDVIGTWDDHDFGKNDAGEEYAKRDESRDLMFEFLDVPKSSPAWKRKGGYQSYAFGEGDRKVKIILLDARYFRDEQPKEGRSYVRNWEGDVLGEAQWTWLESELTNSDAAIHIIGNGIQFITDEHRFEKWANFPKSKQRMLDLFAKTQPQNILMLSGDRHISEITSQFVPGYGMLYDFTSSGMTHSYEASTEYNSHRIGNLITSKSFGLISIDWSGDSPIVSLESRGTDNQILDGPIKIFE